MKYLLSAAFIAACTTQALAGDPVDAKIKLFQFQPNPIEVKAGTQVTWTNGDDIEHSVTAGAPGKESGAFDSGFFKKDGTFTQTFDKPGTYDYFCKRHNSMKGKVVVTQ
jgi:amicyanin